jgi:hypothetical protein
MKASLTLTHEGLASLRQAGRWQARMEFQSSSDLPQAFVPQDTVAFLQ